MDKKTQQLFEKIFDKLDEAVALLSQLEDKIAKESE